MKKVILLLSFFCLLYTATQAQSIKFWGMIPYSVSVPTNNPSATGAHIWYDQTRNDLFIYDRTHREWAALAKAPAYGEISLSNDTSSLSFAATTALPVEDLTAGLMNDFSLVGDSALRYNGYRTKVFRVNYSATVQFAEAANTIFMYVDLSGTPALRSRQRQTLALTTDKGNIAGSCIVSMSTGQTLRLMTAPTAHTGTDIALIVEANLNVEQLN
jgi:hypothetical protein